MDFSALRDEFVKLVDAFKADAHVLFSKVEDQASADLKTVADQATQDVNTAAGDVAQDTATVTTPPPTA